MALTPDQILTLSVPELGLRILRQLANAHQVNRRNFIAGVYATLPPRPGVPVQPHGRSMNQEPEFAHALAEAWDWLFINGCISPDPVAGQSNYFVTRRGRRVAADASLLGDISGW